MIGGSAEDPPIFGEDPRESPVPEKRRCSGALEAEDNMTTKQKDPDPKDVAKFCRKMLRQKGYTCVKVTVLPNGDITMKQSPGKPFNDGLGN